VFNQFLTILSIITALSITQFGASAPKNNAVPTNTAIEKELQLAMLDLNRIAAAQAKPKINHTRSVRKESLISKKRSNVALPANCLKWSTHQINRKAKQFDKAISDYSRQYHVDKDLIKSVIAVESCFKTKAKSHAGAEGLMQLIPATAERFGVKKSYDPRQNIRGGVKYLRFLKDRYKGDLVKVLAAYNAGEGKVDKHKGVPPYKETKLYVKNVLKMYTRLNPKAWRVSAVYDVAKQGQKPGRHGWEYNRSLAPHLYKK